jgi:hypothetical protein
MTRCEITLNQSGFQSDMNNSANPRKIVKCLPTHIRSNWVERADQIIISGREPNFTDLTEFVKIKSRLARSMYGMDMCTEQKAGHMSNRPRRGTTMAVSAVGSNLAGKCACSVGDCVQIEKCPHFTAMLVNERKLLLKGQWRCFNCLRPRLLARDCKSPNQCPMETCAGMHHELLHVWKN